MILIRHVGTSKNAPPRDYSLENSETSRIFRAFTSISIIAAIFGNGILPEIQVYFINLTDFNFLWHYSIVNFCTMLHK